MKVPSKLDVWLAGVKAGKRAASSLGADMVRPLDELRPKRAKLPGRCCRLYVDVPLTVKADMMRLCREFHLTQSELGYVIVRAALDDEAWLKALLPARR